MNSRYEANLVVPNNRATNTTATPVNGVLQTRSFDATGALTVYLALVFFVPARWVVPGLGAAGRPANLWAIGLLGLWCVVKLLPSFERRRTIMRWPILINIVVVLISYSLGYDRGLPQVEALSADRDLLKLAGFTGLVLVTSEGIPSIDHLTRLVRRLVTFNAIIALVGVIQFVTRFDPYSKIRFPGLVLNRDLSGLGERGLASLVRVRGSFGHPIEFGVAMGMVLPLAIHLALHARNDREKYKSMAIVALHAGAAALSISRSAIVAVGTGLVVLIWTWSFPWKVRAIVSSMIFTVALRAAVPGLLGTLRAIIVHWRNDPSIQNRTSDYDIAWAYVAERPWFGRGTGTFIPSQYILLDNAYLGRIVSTGWVGLGSLLLIFLTSIGCSYMAMRTFPSNRIRHLAAALTAIGVVGLVSCATFDLFFFPSATSVLTISFGLAAAIAKPRFPVPRSIDQGAPEGLMRPVFRLGYIRPTWQERIEKWKALRKSPPLVTGEPPVRR